MHAQRFALRHPAGTTTILVGAGALSEASAVLETWLEGRSVFVVSTPQVLELHGDGCDAALRNAARVVFLEVPEGEEAKTLDQAARLWRHLVALGGKRDSRMVAFGGGSVGDLTGFVAGCYLRGVEYAQLPTTLLAQVDAAIGGKTAIDLPESKNSVGLFHHPSYVVADTGLLATLSKEERRAGLLEAIKVAVLLDADLLAELELNLDQLIAGDVVRLARVVAPAAALKARVVERDPGEKDERRLLNFGHTLAHALEVAAGYRDLRHGEAVGYGMLFALRLAMREGLDLRVADRILQLLARCGLPRLPKGLTVDGLLELAGRDKKAREGGLAWVLPVGLCQGWIAKNLPESLVREELIAFLADPWAL